MEEEKTIKIATHDGKFHADEVFAIAILKKVYKNIEVIRTRDKNLLSQVDMRIDIGGEYNSITGDFDHHQKSFDMAQESGIPYSTVGLIWKHFGKKIVKSDDAWERIRRGLIEFLDAHDTGIEYSNSKLSIYSVGSVIGSFNTVRGEKDNEEEQFNKALDCASDILNNEIRRAENYAEGLEIVKKAIKDNPHEKFILLEEGLPKGPIMDETDILYIVSSRRDGKWGSIAVQKESTSFDNRKDFPKTWGGLTDEELEKVTRVAGATFCHKNLFYCVAKTKESIIELTKKSINN